VEYRPTTNTAILWNTGHTMGLSSTGEVGKLRVWIWLVYSLHKNEYRKTDWKYHKKGTKIEWRKLEEITNWGYHRDIHGNITGKLPV
jgi:hypothetical protein